MYDQWTKQRIAWYQRAVSYCGFDRVLADALTPYLPQTQTVCDLGCGTGYLSMELARRGCSVTACDRDAEAIGFLRSEAERRKLPGLKVLEADWTRLGQESGWDSVVSVFTGSGQENLSCFLRLAHRRLILAVKDNGYSLVRTEAESRRRRAAGERLEALLLPYAVRSFSISAEFGQPFRSEAEFQNYLDYYRADADTAAEAAARIRRTDGDYPLYLPAQKHLRILVADTGERA